MSSPIRRLPEAEKPEDAIALFRCERCKHTWQPRNPAWPLRCAKCKSPYWQTKAKS